MVDHRSYTHNFQNSGLNGIRTHDLCDTGAVLLRTVKRETENNGKYFILYSATSNYTKSDDLDERKSPTYRFANHFHVGIHGFCGKGITTKYKVLILCK